MRVGGGRGAAEGAVMTDGLDLLYAGLPEEPDPAAGKRLGRKRTFFPDPRLCERCGAPYWPITTTQVKHRKFCSQSCAAAGKAARRPSVERECEICGAKFTAFHSEVLRGTGRFCSRDCRAEWDRRGRP